MPIPWSEVAPVMTAVRWVLDMVSPLCMRGSDQVRDQAGGLCSCCRPFIVGDIAGFEFQREVAVVAGIGEGLEPARDVHRAVADREVDVPLPGTASRMWTCCDVRAEHIGSVLAHPGRSPVRRSSPTPAAAVGAES